MCVCVYIYIKHTHTHTHTEQGSKDNPWEQVGWADMIYWQRVCWAELGWTQRKWDLESDPNPETDDMEFDQLTDLQVLRPPPPSSSCADERCWMLGYPMYLNPKP